MIIDTLLETVHGLMSSPLLVLPGLLYLSWRLWAFSAAPHIWRSEPRVLPYWIPFIGHTWAFVRNPEKLINNGFHYFGSSRPFSIIVAGRRTVILRDVQDVAAVWKNTQALSIDPFVVSTLGAFGISKPTLEKIFADPQEVISGEGRAKSLLINENPTNKVYMDLERDWFAAQLLRPDALKQLLTRYLSELRQALAWESLSVSYMRLSGPSEKTISLTRFCQYTVSYCSTNTFFGEGLQQTAPDFLSHYQEFETESWKIFYRLPAFLARKSHRAKEKAVDGLVDWMANPQEAQWIFRTIIAELGHLGVGKRDIAAFVMVIIWAINNNAHKVGFWILAHLLHDTSYHARVQKEIDAAYSGPETEPDMSVLLTECPYLDAIWYETMRLYNATSAIREASIPCVVGGRTIHVGDQLVAPFRQFHLNCDLFGHDAADFNPQRFIRNKTLSRSKGYSPFGGCHTYCPGRLFAQREIYLFVAETLRHYHLELAPREGGGPARVPFVDKNTPSAAAMSPDQDVVVKIRQRVHENTAAATGGP
jgi:hypothetical protein